MADSTYLSWPFFTDPHRALQRDLAAWRGRELEHHDDGDPGEACRAYVAQLGAAGWLKYAVPRAYGGVLDTFDVRSICLIRETLAYTSGLAEFAFAMQGLGSAPIALYGSEAQARCMETEDFARAYRAFVAKQPPAFEGN